MKPIPRPLLEFGVLFLPSTPAYLWIWPNVSGGREQAFQIGVYIYFLAGALWIGLRRWNLSQLGLNWKGLGLSLACGLALLAGRLLVIFSVSWHQPAPPFSMVRLGGELLYYFGLVGLVEELLFRGLLYRILEEWGGVRWAIWGTSLGFMLWHIPGQGLLVGLAGFIIGLVFALLRWRAGGIAGLIVVHGLADITSVELMPRLDYQQLGRPEITYPALLVLGYLLILLLPVYLWKIHPWVMRRAGRIPASGGRPRSSPP
jgi:membrane protease YdiL (CAAX protease family)